MSTSSPEPAAGSPDQASGPGPSTEPPVAGRPAAAADTAAPGSPAAGDADGSPATGDADGADRPATEGTDADAAPVGRVRDLADPATVRRAPRYGRFAVVGFLLGALLSLVLALLGVSDYSLRDVFLILLIGLGTAGAFAGLGWALIADRRSLRRRD